MCIKDNYSNKQTLKQHYEINPLKFDIWNNSKKKKIFVYNRLLNRWDKLLKIIFYFFYDIWYIRLLWLIYYDLVKIWRKKPLNFI